jgi:predicted RecA/RadA family phage recombinase
MKNFIAVGDRLTITAPADIASGEGVLVGTLFGVAEGVAATGAEVVLKLAGVFDLPKAPSQAWTTGAAIYWDATEARCTTVGTGHRLIGAAVRAVGDTPLEIVGRVRLNACFGIPVA